MFRLFECCALSFFERFVLSFSLKIERFVSDSAEIWICGLYKTRSVNDLQVRIRKRTEDDPTVILWLRNLEREKPRYYRDNMKLLLHVISEYGKETVIAALQTCLEKNIYNSLSVQEISGSIHRSKDNMNGMTFQAPTSIPETADCHPEKTDINQYNKFFE